MPRRVAALAVAVVLAGCGSSGGTVPRTPQSAAAGSTAENVVVVLVLVAAVVALGAYALSQNTGATHKSER